MWKSRIFSQSFLFVFILASIYALSSKFMTMASSQDNEIKNEVIFTIPIGNQGIHYAGNNNQDSFTWGPAAFTVAPDGTFWIADTPDNHLLHYSPKGVLLDKIAIGGYIIGAGDLEVTPKEIWILDIASFPPKVVQFSLNGKMLRVYNMPKGLYLEDGLSGIVSGNDGSLLIDLGDDKTTTRLISATGIEEQSVIGGYEFEDKIYTAFSPDLREKDISKGYLIAGNQRINIQVANNLGGLRILHINPDGSFVVEVVEFVLNFAFHVDQKIYRYDPAGNFIGMARAPLGEQYTFVAHNIAVGPDGDVYALITRPNGGEIQKLTFTADLPSILTPSNVEESINYTQSSQSSLEGCQSFDLIIEIAAKYANNSINIDSYHINDPYNECPGRQTPRYLVTPGPHSSVSYDWGGYDTVAGFNTFMGQYGYFAGDINETIESCSRGVDCSGLVTNAWGLEGGHWGTCSLESVSTPLPSRDYLHKGDILNRCLISPRHTMIFVSFYSGGVWVYESTAVDNIDRVVMRQQPIAAIDNYTPRRYTNACFQVRMPMLRNAISSDASNFPSNPYPSPNLDLPSNPYP